MGEVIDGICEFIGKVAYKSRGDAVKSLPAKIKRSFREDSVYQCSECGFFHITSVVNSKTKRRKYQMRNEDRSGVKILNKRDWR